ncbi:hypothetical protein [Rhodococcus erythropolis]|uniref:hypothetical protein n=1 Tax=Rhodococcus erythropolis TaxID=1833 RepID=UPI001BEC7341|nr:hypothetical protein [Rhodococcus erythropolis]MBT2263850.1 hypothetical protein [Rhodococcus erythropolis]
MNAEREQEFQIREVAGDSPIVPYTCALSFSASAARAEGTANARSAHPEHAWGSYVSVYGNH